MTTTSANNFGLINEDIAHANIFNQQAVQDGQTLTAVNILELLERDLPPRKNIISPWLPEQGLAMIHAKRGIGKTYLALTVALAVVSGKSILRWNVEKPQGVLYIDGEMPAVTMKERIVELILKNDLLPSTTFKIVNPDLQDGPPIMPNLATLDGQMAVDRLITDEIKLIIVDNISCLVRGGQENKANSWESTQQWALRHRAMGRSVLFIHHSGKTGLQRGTSKREDVLDTVIALEPSTKNNDEGASFKIVFEKARGFYGKQTKPFTVKLSNGIWEEKKTTYDQVVQLANKGLNQTEIASKIGRHKSTISRHYNSGIDNGDIVPSAESGKQKK